MLQWYAWGAAGALLQHLQLILDSGTCILSAFAFSCCFLLHPLNSCLGPADEHHFPTVLALAGRDNETDCQGWVTGAAQQQRSSCHRLLPHPHCLLGGSPHDALRSLLTACLLVTDTAAVLQTRTG